MNNGKVRIYDLSKELNLDNKDILEICKQLNVSVRSHSSTITQSQAERIKAAAELYTPSHVSGKGHSNSSSGESDTIISCVKSSESNKKKHKQEILAIHKHNRQRSISKAKLDRSSQSTTVLTPPPQRPQVQPQSPAPSKPVDRSDITPTLADPPKEPGSQQELNQESSNKEKRAAKTFESESISRKPKKKVATARHTGNIKLNEPPDRQTPATSGPKINRSIPKPVKKTESAIQLPEKKLSVKSKKETERKAAAPTKTKKQRQDLPDRSLLQRPQRLKPSQEDDLTQIALEETHREENGLEDNGADALEPTKKPEPKKLKRPTPPRPTKRKPWEEEEDAEEKKAKAAKAGAKNKRRKLVIDEDDDELDTALESVSLSVSVSRSVARPPKPKSLTPQPAADKTLSTAKKTRKTPGLRNTTTRTDNRQKGRERKVQERPQTVVLSNSLSIRELSDRINTPETEIIKLLFFKGIAVNITQTLEINTARLVTEELGIKVETEEEKSAAAKGTDMLDVKDLEHLQHRPPVVTIMGHVDHGKTTLLDSIRKTKVAQGEAGGITQHIGAYHVDVEHEDKKQQIVFLDTPGHEAFTAMRARGTRVTDIAILVVAADDGVQPQTKEAISHAKAAEVPIVVAINKTDKPEAQPDRIKQELMELELVPEEWGGNTIMVPVSALKGDNLDELLEMILLVSELEELSANPNRPAKGTVIEAHLDRTRGPVASLLVQNGTLRVGDIIVAGSVLGKIRAMIDDRGAKVEAATPSFAVEVLGLNEVPAAGDEFDVFESEKEARAIAQERSQNNRASRLQAMSSRRVTLSSISESAKEGSLKELNLILKADVQGSVEAIIGSLKQLPQNEVQIRLLLAAPGEVTETDVDLAAASGAVIIGFNTSLATGSRQAADREGVDIKEYNIIYKLLDDIQGAMEGLLDPEEVEESLGEAEVRAIFTVGRGAVAGCYVLSGKIVRNCLLRVRRKDKVIFEGMLADSLKRIKEDVREVNAGYECGIGSVKFNDWQEGDIIEAYQMVLKRRSLSAN